MRAIAWVRRFLRENASTLDRARARAAERK